MFKYGNKRILSKKIMSCPDLLFCIFTTNLNVLFHGSSHRHGGGGQWSLLRSRLECSRICVIRVEPRHLHIRPPLRRANERAHVTEFPIVSPLGNR